MEPTFSQRESQFAEAIHASLVRQYGLTTNPTLAVVKKFAQTLDIKSAQLAQIFSVYFPQASYFDVNQLAKFLRAVGNAQNGVPVETCLQQSAEPIRAKSIQDINKTQMQKGVQIQVGMDYICDPNLAATQQMATQMVQTLSQLQSQDPSLPFLFCRDASNQVKKVITDFSVQMQAELEEISQHLTHDNEEEKMRLVNAMVDELCSAGAKDLHELQLTYQKTIKAEAELAKSAKVLESYGMETNRLRAIIKMNDEIMEKNQKLLQSFCSDEINRAVDACFLENAFQLESLHERMAQLISSPEQPEKAQTPMKVEQQESAEVMFNTNRSVVHQKLNSWGKGECPSPDVQQRSDQPKTEDEFWTMDQEEQKEEEDL